MVNFLKNFKNKIVMRDVPKLGQEQIDKVDLNRDLIFYAIVRKDGSRTMWATGKCVRYLTSN